MMAQRIWEEKLNIPDYPVAAWQMVMRNRFQFTDQRKLSIPKIKGAKTFKKQYDMILEHLQEGNLTAREAQQLSGLITAGLGIQTQEDMERLSQEIEELKKKADDKV
jgi:hypothetical protein